jgi:transglutaminase-like putative cysteine protease
MNLESRKFLSGGPGKLMRTILLIEELIEKGKRDARIRALATRAVNGTREGNFDGELVALSDFIKGQVRYTKDPSGIESVSDAIDTLKLGYGDCDDLCVCLSSMAEAIGHPTRLKIVGMDRYSHIFPEVLIKGAGWVPVDLARPHHKIFEPRTFPLEKTRTRKRWSQTRAGARFPLMPARGLI